MHQPLADELLAPALAAAWAGLGCDRELAFGLHYGLASTGPALRDGIAAALAPASAAPPRLRGALLRALEFMELQGIAAPLGACCLP